MNKVLIVILLGIIAGCSSNMRYSSLSHDEKEAICSQSGYEAGRDNLPYDGLCQSINPKFVAQYKLGKTNNITNSHTRSLNAFN